MPVVCIGVAAASVAACTIYAMSLYFDSDPYLFNGGKTGKLEAISAHNKKSC